MKGLPSLPDLAHRLDQERVIDTVQIVAIVHLLHATLSPHDVTSPSRAGINVRPAHNRPPSRLSPMRLVP